MNPETPQSQDAPAVVANELAGSAAPSPAIDVAPAEAAAPPQASAPQEGSSPGVIILQWLTYAFWGWTVLALSFLTSLVFSNLIDDGDTGGMVPYAVAAVLVLLPISYIVDKLYAKREPAKKSGPAVWVMVIHAVIFALFGIGSLIAAVVSLVIMATSSSDSHASQVALYSALVIAAYYAMTFVRTLNPPLLAWFSRWYRMIMLLSVGIIALLGIVGPAAQERATRTDRLISENLYTIVDAVSGYATSNDKLPANLDALQLRGDAARVIDKDLVKYKPEGVVATGSSQKSTSGAGTTLCRPGVTSGRVSTDSCNFSGTSSTSLLRYQLCVTYTHESKNYNSYSGSRYNNYDNDGYQTYISAGDHPKGEVCYKLQTDGTY